MDFSLYIRFFESYPVCFVVCFALLGLAVGSFLNVVIYRLPIMLERDENDSERFDLAKPDSACPRCGHQIAWYENIPVLSYLALKAKCRGCALPISIRYPLIELLTGCLWAWVAIKFGFSLEALIAVFLASILVSLFFIDLDTMYLPDVLTLPLLWVGLLVSTEFVFISTQSAVWGAAIGYATPLLISKLMKSRCGDNAIGGGDLKLLAALGAFLGAASVMNVLLLASIIFVVVECVKMRMGRADKIAAFGPAIVVAGWLEFMLGASVYRLGLF
ncbi:prepilin peptidase [Alteromonas mediterranea]|uniref:prepilin peptidase n=1 Tax=Alteromonas mediterranea TaxID=314275 RepID=UPI000A8DC18D|nr:A24 family peptidase [Alteromonas mediterranea]